MPYMKSRPPQLILAFVLPEDHKTFRKSDTSMKFVKSTKACMETEQGFNGILIKEALSDSWLGVEEAFICRLTVRT